MANTYLNREEASELLNISTRTFDRYIRKYKLKKKKKGRTVLIRKTDVDIIINDHIGKFMTDFDQIKNQEAPIHTEKQVIQESVKAEEVSEMQTGDLSVKDIEIREIKKNGKNIEEAKIYKELYVETKKELKEKQERLEAATYRVGQLEAQFKSAVPLLDFNRKEQELKELQLSISQKEVVHRENVVVLEQKVRSERVAKWIYLSLVGLLLVAEPILFFIWAFA